ncbi:hypothetical protein [Microbacterium testaceum]|uniref:hypothetical protein n=1 Tax=Microbacterium testaceum TaxID=2033 RepID=UPI002435B182|nr:hypothetical protein [Microbacterium testaceum]
MAAVSGAGAGTLSAMTSARMPRGSAESAVAAAARSTVRGLPSLGFVADTETLDAPIVLMARNV